MKLYMHPVSTACRPVRMLIAENGIACDEETIDILQAPLSGALRLGQSQPDAAVARGWRFPPDGRFRDSEILADKYDLPSYPKT